MVLEFVFCKTKIFITTTALFWPLYYSARPKHILYNTSKLDYVKEVLDFFCENMKRHYCLFIFTYHKSWAIVFKKEENAKTTTQN